MKIETTINKFNLLIELIKEHIKNPHDNNFPFRYGICVLALHANIKLGYIFFSYYQNYVGDYGYLKGMEIGTLEGWKLRLKFLKKRSN